MMNHSVLIWTYLITGGIFVGITVFKVIKFVTQSEEKDWASVISAKKELFSQPGWKIGTWIYAPISFAFILLTIIIAAVSMLFRKRQ